MDYHELFSEKISQLKKREAVTVSESFLGAGDDEDMMAMLDWQ